MACRLIALVLTLTVSAAPVLAAVCEAACAAAPIIEAGHGCHGGDALGSSTRLVAGAHICGHDASLPTAPGTRAEQPILMSTAELTTMASVASPEPSVPLMRGSRSPELRAHATPLRI